MYVSYQYYFQNLLDIWQNQTYQDFAMVPETHRFLTLYARKFANVIIPSDFDDFVRLDIQQSRRIGKAMLSHEGSERNRDAAFHQQWPGYRGPHKLHKYTARRRKITRDLKCDLKRPEIDTLWGLTEGFLFGGEVWIMINLDTHDIYDSRSIPIPSRRIEDRERERTLNRIREY